MKRIGLIVSAVFVTMLLGATAFAQTPSSGGVGGRPANPDPENPRSQSIFIYNLKPSEVKKDQIYISNGTDEVQTVELFAVDGTVSNDGAYTCKQNSEEKVDGGAWISLSKTEVTIEAKKYNLVDFEVAVPKNTEPGEHTACLAIQTKGQEVTQGSIRLTTRQAVRMAITVPGDIHRKVTIETFSVKAETVEKGEENDKKKVWQQSFNVGLKNEGNVSADTKIDIKVRNLFGKEVYSNGGQYPVMADESFKINYSNDRRPFWGGWFTATADISYDKRAGTFGLNDKSQLLHASAKPVSFFLWPTLPAILIIIGVILAVVSSVIWLKMQRNRPAGRKRSRLSKHDGKRMWEAYTVKAGDTIDSLADDRDVSALKVAALNKIQAPYNIEVGQKIYLPQKK